MGRALWAKSRFAYLCFISSLSVPLEMVYVADPSRWGPSQRGPSLLPSPRQMVASFLNEQRPAGVEKGHQTPQ